MPKVIGISGNSGVGKTTLAQALAKALHATLIHWDDFDEISSGPEDYVSWYYRGENYNEWDYQLLADTIKTLKSSQSLYHPVSSKQLHPTDYIIFDAPNARLHIQTGQYIDICIHIELPLDLALARRLIRDFKFSGKIKDELIEELEFYVLHSRPLFFDDDIKKTADLIVDGMLSVELQVQEVLKYLNHKK